MPHLVCIGVIVLLTPQQVGSERQSKYVDSQRVQGLAPALSCLSMASAVYFIQFKWPCLVFILERKTDSFSTDQSETTPHDCQSPALCVAKFSQKYHLSKQSICLLGVRGWKVRGNPCNYHFMSVTRSYAIWLHSWSLCCAHTKETPELFTHSTQ